MTSGFYRAFEDKYRGSREVIKSRLRVYIPFIEPFKKLYNDIDAIDLGCGRCEWIELLNEQGLNAHGVDIDDSMLTDCRDLALSVETADAVSYLKTLPDESQVVVSGFHLAEHIPFVSLQELVQEALRVLKPAGLLILETPNPENIVVSTVNFYIDPTHQRPIPPQLLSFLPEYYGFARTKILRLQESLDLVENNINSLLNVLNGVSPDYSIVAQKNARDEQLIVFNTLFEKEYGLTLETLASSYDSQKQTFYNLVEAQLKIAEFQARANAAEAQLKIAESQARANAAEAQLKIAESQARANAAEAQLKIAESQACANATEAQLKIAESKTHASVAGAQLIAAESQARADVAEAQLKIAESQARANAAEENINIIELKACARALEDQARIDELGACSHHWWTVSEELNLKLQSIYASRSWQLTKPLRKIGFFVKKIWHALSSRRYGVNLPSGSGLIQLCLRPFIRLLYNTTIISRVNRWSMKHPKIRMKLLDIRNRMVVNPALYASTAKGKENALSAHILMQLVGAELANSQHKESIIYVKVLNNNE